MSIGSLTPTATADANVQSNVNPSAIINAAANVALASFSENKPIARREFLISA